MIVSDIIKILKISPLFKMQTDNLLNALAFTAEKKSFSTGDLIIKSDMKKPQCIIILEGKAYIQRKQKPIQLSPGSSFGMLSLINGRSSNDALIAGSAGMVLIIDSSLFEKLTSEFPDFTIKLKKHLKENFDKQASGMRKLFN